MDFSSAERLKRSSAGRTGSPVGGKTWLKWFKVSYFRLRRSERRRRRKKMGQDPNCASLTRRSGAFGGKFALCRIQITSLLSNEAVPLLFSLLSRLISL